MFCLFLATVCSLVIYTCSQRPSGSINSIESQKNLDQIFTKTGSYRVRFTVIQLIFLCCVSLAALFKGHNTTGAWEMSGISCQLTELTAYLLLLFVQKNSPKEQSNMWTCRHLVNVSIDGIHKSGVYTYYLLCVCHVCVGMLSGLGVI